MSNQIDLFSSKLPAHVTNAKSAAMQAMAGGIAGGGFGNRISLRNSKFRFLQAGNEVGVVNTNLEVVVFAMSTEVQRMYYAGAYVADSKDKPTCFSTNGKVPSDDSPEKQAAQCATCKQNVKGSGRMPNTKACAYKKRVVVLPPEDLEGEMYALDVNATSMFGEQDPSKNLYSFKGYYEKLVAHNMDIAAIVTELSFDDKASVPKIHFKPIRALTAEEFAIVQERMNDPEIEVVLTDMGNEAEVAEQPQQQLQQPTKATPEPKGVGGLVQDVAPAVKKGFPTKGNGQQPQPQQTTRATTVPAAPAKELVVDLKNLVNFDD